MNKKNNEAWRRQEDMALNRGLLWVAGAIVLEFLLLLVNRFYIHYTTEAASVNLAYALMRVLKLVRLLGAAGVLVCLVWTLLRLYRTGRCKTLPVAALCVCGALTVCAHISLSFKDAGVRMLFLLVPAWAALALVYYLYQKEFFLSGLTCGSAAVGVWLLRVSGGSKRWFVLAAIAAVLVALLALLLKRNGGVLRTPGGELRVLSAKAGYTLVFLSCAVSLAALTLALALGGTVAYYIIYAIAAWLFGLLVYYTVKLM